LSAKRHAVKLALVAWMFFSAARRGGFETGVGMAAQAVVFVVVVYGLDAWLFQS
jgi:hypothetical protein